MHYPMRLPWVLCCALLMAGIVLPVAAQSPNNNAALARQGERINQLETEIRRLTGENEGLNHRIGQMEKQLQALEGRLQGMANPAPIAEQPPALIEPPADAAQPADAPAATAATTPADGGTVPGADKGAKVLGTLRVGSEGAAPPKAAAPPPVKMTPEETYEKAHNLIVKDRDYAQAEKLLQQFVNDNSKHKLASNAYYWLGRTHFVRKDFKNAAYAFAEGFQKFPKAEKAPANLLNLGMALNKLGKKTEACTTWGQLTRAFPKAPAAVKRRVDREKRLAKCR